MERFRYGFSASYDTQKSHRSRHRMHKSSGSSHRTMSRSLSCDSQSKGFVSTPRGSTKVNLSKLEIAALWRYWRHFNLVSFLVGEVYYRSITTSKALFMLRTYWIARWMLSPTHQKNN